MKVMGATKMGVEAAQRTEMKVLKEEDVKERHRDVS